MSINLRPHEKINLKKPLMHGAIPAGDYIVQHQDKWNTVILYEKEGKNYTISTPVAITDEASQHNRCSK